VADLVDRFRAAFRALLKEEIPHLKFMTVHRYAVTACDYDAQTFDGEPSVSKYGLPRVSKVPIRGPLKLDLQPGSSVLVGFESGDPAYPFMSDCDQLQLAAKATLRSTGEVLIGEGASLPAARQGDMVLTPSLGVVCMFAVNAAGDTGAPPPGPMNTMTPYFVSFTTVTSVPPIPAFPPVGNLPGIVSSGSVFVKES